VIQISSFEQLDEVMSNLHDCPFDLARSISDAASETWCGRFLRPLWDDPRAKHRGLFLLYSHARLPVVEATLTIAGVKNRSIVDDQGIGRYSLDEVLQIQNGVRLSFNEALRIDPYLAGWISATYDEQPLSGVYAIYRQYFLMQSGPEIEREL
jgi:hypothetical protein